MKTRTKRVRINYGINRREGRKVMHRTDHAYLVPMSGHQEVKRMLRLIARRHPGWNLTGWCKPVAR